MSANTIITSVVTGGSNGHSTTAEEANAFSTDFVSAGVVGTIGLNAGSGGTGSFCVNADSSPDLGVTIKSGQAYVAATPSGQNSQILRARASADYTAYTINPNSSGSTKYDWIYLKVDPTKANSPASDASDVATIYTSRSSSNNTDNGSPPTYGLLLAVVTVANGASSITNSNISDRRTQAALSISGTSSATGWTPLSGYVPSAVAFNGNRSYSLTFSSADLTGTLSPGVRLMTTRTAQAPTQCTSLNGSTQYYSKSSPTGMTFTDDFVVSAWVKLTNYPASGGTLVSRYNGTSGFFLDISSAGQISLYGLNGGSGNYSGVLSYASLPLNKWVHIAAQLDMSTFTASTTTSYIMIDGVDVPAQVSRGGTNPTSLSQAGNLEIGSKNGGLTPFPGKIAQLAIYSAKVTQANIKATISQGLSGSETSLVSAYSFNNSINDLSANANNLTANGSAVATNADSPFGGQANGTISSTLDYGIVQSVTYSTNSTVVVQVPEGCTIPTTGGVSSISYSTQKMPYGFPGSDDKWSLYWIQGAASNTINTSTITSATGSLFTLPIGIWDAVVSVAFSTASIDFYFGLSSSTTAFSDTLLSTRAYQNATTLRISRITLFGLITNTAAATTYNIVFHTGAGGNGNILSKGDDANNYSYVIYKNAYL